MASLFWCSIFFNNIYGVSWVSRFQQPIGAAGSYIVLRKDIINEDPKEKIIKNAKR
jgi:hypothetical protein